MVTWDIRRGGHAWGGEAMSRYELTPEKTEMVTGKLYATEEERLTMLALSIHRSPIQCRSRIDGCHHDYAPSGL